MKLKYTLLVFLCFAQTNLWAQYNLKENNVWTFGYHAGLDFNSGTPIPIVSAMNYNTIGVPTAATAGTVDACAAVCDTGGHLLFYSAGDTIYNRNNEVMPGGVDLTPYPNNGTDLSQAPCVEESFDTTYDTVEGVVNMTIDTFFNVQSTEADQGTVILPVLNNPNQYYVFSLQRFCFADPEAGRLYYSIVDMTLNGGMGGVVPTQKGILLDSALAEKMTAVPGDNCDMWLLVHGNQNDTCIAFDITESGINPVPVKSAIGNMSGLLSYSLGYMKVSPNRRRIAIASIAGPSTGLELYDFDPATGIVSDPITMSSISVWSLEFSPDNTKLYVNQQTPDTGVNFYSYVSQYDVSLPTATAIANSRIDLDTAENNGGPQGLTLGPDGKIYLGAQLYNEDTDVLDIINAPNEAGTACQFTPYAITLDANTYVGASMQNMYVKPIRDTVFTSSDTTLSAAGNLLVQIPSGYFNYLWSDGSTDSSNVLNDTGTYWVSYGNYCTYRTDTFVVRPYTGIAKVNGTGAATLTAYPSPAHNTATVAISGLSKVDGTLQIIDMVGRTVLQQPCDNRKQILDVSDIAPGVYTILYTDKLQQIQLHQQLVIAR
jgi:hypothetical protein